MADRAVKQFEDELNGRAGLAARLRGTPALAFALAAETVGAAREAAGLSRVSEDVLAQVTGGPRPRDLPGILANGARGLARYPAAEAAVASGGTLREVAMQRSHLLGYAGTCASLQQLGAYGLSVIGEAMDQEVRRFLGTCERVAADEDAAPALRMEAAHALLLYQGEVEALAALRDDAAAYTRAVAAEAEAGLALRAETAAQLGQVNGLLAQMKGKRTKETTP